MSLDDIIRRILPPIGDVSPHLTSAYGVRRKKGTSPHRGIDANYNVGPNGQTGINLEHPALRAPVDGTVTNAGQGTAGRIAIRDANGISHEILHTHARHVSVGDPVIAGQLFGTMGNTGVDSPNLEHGDHHFHYQLKDPAGNVLNPSAFWDQQGPVDPNPAPPSFLGEYLQYLHGLGANAGSAAPTDSHVAAPFGTGGQFVPGSATSSRTLYETGSFVAPSDEAALPDRSRNFPRLVRITGPTAVALKDMATRPAPPPNEIPPDRPASFDDRFGDWASTPETSAPRGPYQDGPPQQGARPLGIVSGQPMPDWPFPPPIWGIHDEAALRGKEDWAATRRKPADWSNKRR